MKRFQLCQNIPMENGLILLAKARNGYLLVLRNKSDVPYGDGFFRVYKNDARRSSPADGAQTVALFPKDVKVFVLDEPAQFKLATHV
jgi:hypothetical protein